MVKIKEWEINYSDNSCEVKGHLPALKAVCQDWKNNIELNKQVNKIK